ncbi:cytochrome P450 [Mycolicibacterium sp. 018/SC-01/001]|uniref:cytochrome P450 n=1 Tax=Mycolicibacterium sp. 018/SC-01/001 TaxID=2592069 RepID=UPI00117C01A9|nr:cytochrome P450 [Mycolicibacterium sp. 018/SC-01/001]TRW79619.1 cytochrome P450 [Mycolicibacterium sp. 018/SC-01/001]
MAVLSDVSWDPFDRELTRDPYPMWRRLRDEFPVYHNEQYDFYALSRFADVVSASMDPGALTSTHGITLDAITPDPWTPPRAMIMMDPPDHTALRKVVNRTFYRGAVAKLEDLVRGLVRGYLDPLVGAGGFDYVRDFSMKLPVMVISSLLGFPERDHDQLREWSDAAVTHDEGATAGGMVEEQRANADLIAYYADQVQQRRGEPTDDIVGDLMRSDITLPDGTMRRLDDGELLMFIAMINVAGNETVARLLGWAALTLARYPGERAKLTENPEMIPGAVEELLRFEAPSPVQGRFSTRDLKYHGTVIPAGSKVALLTGSAGRDDRQYDRPDDFDVERTGIRHVSFGHGSHFCLGAALARLEARIALEETLARFPTWDVTEDAVTYVATNSVRGPASVPITT